MLRMAHDARLWLPRAFWNANKRARSFLEYYDGQSYLRVGP